MSASILEHLRYWITEELSTLSDTARWSALRSIGMVERECWIEDRYTVERRVFINSIPADTKRFAYAVRGHWGIENRLHWRMDVVIGEDASRIRKGNAPVIFNLDPPSVHELVRTRILQAALGAKAPQGRLER